MFEDRLKKMRIAKGLNMKQAAKEMGLSYTTYVGYEKNEREPNSETLSLLADFFSCSTDYLIGRSEQPNPIPISDLSSVKNIIPMPQMKKVPLIGTIACGEPILAQENVEDYVNMPDNINGTFALRCKGDSMINARILDGDIVYIHEQPTVENGEIAAVLINDEATLKRVYYYPAKATLILKPENPKYDDFVYVGEELENVKILGKAVVFLSNII